MKKNKSCSLALCVIVFASGILVSVFLPDILLIVLLCIALILLGIPLLR